MSSPENKKELTIPAELSISYDGLKQVLSEAISLEKRADWLSPGIHSDMDLVMSDGQRSEIRELRDRSRAITSILDKVVPLEEKSWSRIEEKSWSQIVSKLA